MYIYIKFSFKANKFRSFQIKFAYFQEFKLKVLKISGIFSKTMRIFKNFHRKFIMFQEY